MTGRGWLGLLLVCCLAGQALADDRYLVEFSVWLDGELAGTPVLIVEAGEPASLEQLGEPSYRLTVMVEPLVDSLMPRDTLWLHILVELFGEEGWEDLADTMLGARAGEQTTLSVVEGDRQPTPESANLYLQARTSPLLPADVAN